MNQWDASGRSMLHFCAPGTIFVFNSQPLGPCCKTFLSGFGQFYMTFSDEHHKLMNR